MKITFVSFQEIDVSNRPIGMVRLIYPILNKIEFKIYYLSENRGEDNKRIEEVSQIYKYLKKILYILKMLRYSSGMVRYLQEYLFDWFLSFKIKKPTIIFTTAYVPRTAKKNKEMGGINIFLAGNPYDKKIFDLLKKEEIKWGVKLDDPYTLTKRINFIDRFLSYQDHVIAQTKVSYNTYLGSVKNLTLIKQKVNSKKLMENSSDNVIKNEALTFIYVAHTVWLKGLTYLIEAWQSIDNNNIELHIVGGVHKEVYKIVRSKLKDNIKVHGSVYGKKLSELYKKSHVCIVPSLLDDHPATITEALFNGLPVIATDGCGDNDLIQNNRNGFVIPIADSNSIKEKINWFINNRNKIEEMSGYAKESLKTIELDHSDDLLVNYITELLNRYKVL